MLFGLAKEFHHLGYYDEELWEMIVKTAIDKKKINNTHYFEIIVKCMSEINAMPGNPMEGKLQTKIDDLAKKHYTDNRKWRFDLENA